MNDLRLDSIDTGLNLQLARKIDMARKRRDRGDGRDENGRFIGRSGNPSGRPKKVPDLDMSDIRNFSLKTMDIKIGGEELEMTHHEALIHSIFQSALKGRISAQRLLLDKFEEADLTYHTVRMRYEEYAEAIKNNPDSVPEDVKRLMPIIEASSDPPRSKFRMKTPGKKRRKK